ncbi:MAG: nucleoside deaminase [Verrucomicrobiales bacterium]
MNSTPNNEDAIHLRRAIALAREHMLAGHGGPFGAVIARDGQILGEGWNQVTTSQDPTAHAEVVAIRAATRNTGSWMLTGATLYTSCEPCPMCLAAAWWARVDRIVFAANRDDAAAAGFDDSALYTEVARPLKDRHLPITNALPNEGAAVFQDWLAKEDRVEY